MAIFKCSYRFIDAKAKRQTMVVPVPRGVLTIADITGFMAAQVQAIDDITEAQIDAMAIEIGVALPGGLKGAAVADSDCEEGGLYTFSAAGTDYSLGLRVPALVQALFAGRDIDLTDALSLAFTDSISEGILVGAVTVSPSDFYENDVLGVTGGKKSFRK